MNVIFDLNAFSFLIVVLDNKKYVIMFIGKNVINTLLTLINYVDGILIIAIGGQ